MQFSGWMSAGGERKEKQRTFGFRGITVVASRLTHTRAIELDMNKVALIAVSRRFLNMASWGEGSSRGSKKSSNKTYWAMAEKVEHRYIAR